MEKEFQHPDFGLIRIAVNRRARRIVMRACEGHIRVTVPPFATGRDVERALAKYGSRLKEIQATKIQLIDSQYGIGGEKFRINIQEYKGDNFMWVHNGAIATLMCPEDTDYEKRQEWLRRVITNAVHEEAKSKLPLRLEMLAVEHGFKYAGCSVRNSHTRWGSCSGKGNISLSIYLVLLDDELIDYVLLHELCHTVEMNHGERFWGMLDNLCKGKSKELRGKLKKHTPGI